MAVKYLDTQICPRNMTGKHYWETIHSPKEEEATVLTKETACHAVAVEELEPATCW